MKKFNEVYGSLTTGITRTTSTTGTTGGSVAPLTEEELIQSLQDQITSLLKMVETLTAQLNEMLGE
ncbi:hypothetical protein KKC45_01080 [Patescibacteria group bacterium]|nr:hypothetical protein [Patescibacteria group bacterium]